ncbi:hypothetical protein ACF0H5_016743 [Mactra antiquata]
MSIVLELRKNMIKRSRMVQSAMSKSDEKATKLLLAVSSTYVLFVLPLGIVQSVELIWNGTMVVSPGHPDFVHFMSTKIRLKWTRAFFFFFYQLNFAINFFLYVAASSATRFRANLRNLFGMKARLEESMYTRAPKTNSVAPAPSSVARQDSPNGDDDKTNKVKFDEQKEISESTT